MSEIDRKRIGDIPVACIESGIVMLMEQAAGDPEKTPDLFDRAMKDGVGLRFEGVVCPGCFHKNLSRKILYIDLETGAMPLSSPCTYRILVGPLFVPRSPGF